MRSLSASSFLATALVALSLFSTACANKTPSANAAHTGSITPPNPEFVSHFDASAGELPEGLVVDKVAAYVGFAPTSRVLRVDLTSGVATEYGSLPRPVANQGFMTGLAESANGEIYAGLASFAPEVQAGIYRIPKSGGAASLFAKDSALPFPNALAFDQDGSLFTTDSGTGSVFRIDGSGHAERWASGDALTGNKDACGGVGPGFAIGANGLVVEPDAIYVVNMDQATLLKIPRDAAGNSAAPIVVAGPDCDALGGADGLARAPDGSFVVAVNRQNKIVRVSPQGAIEPLVSGPPLDFPATLAYRGAALYATNFALKNASAGKPAAPGLLRITR